MINECLTNKLQVLKKIRRVNFFGNRVAPFLEMRPSKYILLAADRTTPRSTQNNNKFSKINS